MAALARELRYNDVSALYTAVGEGHISARHVVQRLIAQLGGADDAEDEIAERSTPSNLPVRQRNNEDVGVAVPGAPGILTKLAKCCTPVPGDAIMGFVTRGGGVSVHRTDCTNAASLQEQAERIIDVKWAPSPSSVFLVAIQVEALDRHRLLSDVTRVLADEKVNILSAQVTTSDDRVAVSRFTFEMGDPKHLGPRAQRGAQRRGCVRRLPGDVRGLRRQCQPVRISLPSGSACGSSVPSTTKCRRLRTVLVSSDVNELQPKPRLLTY